MNIAGPEKEILKTVAGVCDQVDGAFNFRINGKSVGRNSTKNITVFPKSNKDGLEIRIKPHTKGESVHIPVVISTSGLKEAVYNDFYIGKGAEVTIIAGCGIYNYGKADSIHDGIHRFYLSEGAKVTYIEKHYGIGPGAGGKILNPTTEVYQAKNTTMMMELEQIKGVDSTIRQTNAELSDNTKLTIKERLLTHGKQTAESRYSINLKGINSTVDVASRSVAQDFSHQTFNARIIGETKCRGHVECDAILKDHGGVLAIPSLEAKSPDATLIHEAAIGKIAAEQLTKLMTLGLTPAEAESKIINGFLSSRP